MALWYDIPESLTVTVWQGLSSILITNAFSEFWSVDLFLSLFTLCLPVMEDGIQDGDKIECFLFGRYLKAWEEKMETILRSQGTWSADGAEGNNVMWLVLHRPFVIPSHREILNNFNQLCIVACDKKSPHCQMWVLFGGLHIKAATSLSHNSIPSKPSVSDSLSDQAQTKQPITGQYSTYPHHKIKPLSQAAPSRTMSTAGVVMNVVKKELMARSGNLYDIIKLADGNPTSVTIMFVKIFHNRDVHWARNGEPKRGDVLILRHMLVSVNQTLQEVQVMLCQIWFYLDQCHGTHIYRERMQC